MVDLVATPLINVGVALTSMLLNATQQQQAAAIVTDARDPITSLTQAILGRRGTKKDIERTIHKDLTLRMHEMSERCHRDGINSDRLASPCAEVEDILNTIDDHEQLLEQAVHDPDAVRALFEEQARSSRIQIDERLVPYFDELIKAVTELFITYAERSASYQQLALKHLLKNDRESREALARMHETIADVPHKVAELVSSDSKPSRVFFGSRPDAVAGERFVERDEHEQLKAVITDPTRHRTVLWGMRGCGKTQLASVLAQQCEGAHWSLVAWVNASSTESITSDLVELAKRLKIDTSDQPAQDVIVRRCLDHLKSAAPTDRLIVFDNVEDINHLTGLIPSGDGVRVVATTTNKVGWEDQGWNSIKVEVFDRNTSIEYLLTVTKSVDHDAADALADRLGDLPLAIAQAAATARHKELSLPEYLKRLESHRKEHAIRPVPGDDYTEDVATALWMAAEDAVDSMKNGTKEKARHQLGALALLAESGVPTRWLDPTVAQLDDDESPDTQRDTDEDAHDALTELIHRSIVQQSTDGSTIMLHRLQAQVLRESWSKNEYNEACAAAAYLLDHVDINRFRRNDTNARRKETLDLTNQLRAISVQEDSQNLLASPQIFRSLSRAFSHASDLGLPYEALTLDVAVEALEGLLGPDHPYTLASRNNLAGAYEGAGRLTEAIPLYEQVLADRIRVLGEYHPQTLISRNNLGSAYMSASRPTDAITLFEQVVVGSIRTMGEDHPDTLMSLNNLAGAYESAGQTDKATVLYEKVLADSIRVLGEDHPHTLATRNNLAGTYISTKNFDDAIVLYKQVIADSIRVLGEDHPHTLTTRNNLVYAYASAGQLTEAIMLNERVISDQIRVLGAEHPHTLISRINLAGTLETVGRIDEAITQFKQILTDCIRILGDNHPSTLTACKNFAHALHTAGRTDEAIIYFEQFVIDSTEILGNDHPSTLIARNNLASLYYAAGRTDEATPLFEQLLTDNIRILGDDHPLTTTVRENLEAARRELEQQAEDSANEEREED